LRVPVLRSRLVRIAFISDTYPGTSIIDKIDDPLKIELRRFLEKKNKRDRF